MLIVVGLGVRVKLSESPEFEQTKAEGHVEHNPLRTVLRDSWRDIRRIIALRVVESCAYYLTATYLLNYVTERQDGDRTVGLIGHVAASLLAVVVTLLAGALTDYVGRRVVYLGGCLLVMLVTNETWGRPQRAEVDALLASKR